MSNTRSVLGASHARRDYVRPCIHACRLRCYVLQSTCEHLRACTMRRVRLTGRLGLHHHHRQRTGALGSFPWRILHVACSTIVALYMVMVLWPFYNV